MKRAGKRTRSKTTYKRSPCPIACVLDLVGDKWTLLLVRDLLWFDKHQYNEMLGSPEKIPTSVLADRLRRLEDVGLISKEAYQRNPVRYTYRLTAAGRALDPVLREISAWGNQQLSYTKPLPAEILQRKPA